MPRWLGLLGSWALMILGLALTAIAGTAEWMNVKEARRFDRFDAIDRFLADQNRAAAESLRSKVEGRAASVRQLQTKVQNVDSQAADLADSPQTIVISTAENKLWLRKQGQTLYEAVVSTGKGTTMIENGKTMVFDTPIGKFKILSKEEHPLWVPPDWHYVEEARKEGLRTVKLNPGQSIDADTGGPVTKDEGPFGWFGGGSHRILKVKGNSVVEIENGSEHELPPGTMIRAGNALVIPPVGTPQRQFDKVLGNYRLNLGDGYAIHGTQAVDQLGRSVSHGCVRVGDKDIEALYAMTNVGDQVIIY